MFVANHCSYMDIPLLCMALGFGTNYKIVSKQELLQLPVLGKSLQLGGHLILDRTDRRSQLQTFKQGVQWLQQGVHLVTFAEGTRSRTGRLGSFKKGAFRMAQHVAVDVMPVSIIHTPEIQPVGYAFPVRPARSIPGIVHFGQPISTKDKSEEEVMEQVWNAIAENLIEEQKPLANTPVTTS
jgi:1-acyl-sn-glycerol-3-phosphate acyltransferase